MHLRLCVCHPGRTRPSPAFPLTAPPSRRAVPFTDGQTGSGKSYSMMGYGPEKGIIPLTTLELFKRADALAQKASEGAAYSYTVEVSCGSFGPRTLFVYRKTD